jgi:hypothetical protein
MENPINNIDWSELRNQKSSLLAVIQYYEDNKVPFIPEHLTGILHLIDSIQDYAVDELGVPEIHVFDFELEEERETEKPVEKFIRESAEKIFDYLCESDGFHQDDEVPSSFIEATMADRFQSGILKAEIRKQILNDLEENPTAFQYDENNIPVYDADMREDYEGLVIDYIRKLYKVS